MKGFVSIIDIRPHSELKRLKALEEENARLKRIIAQQALDNELLKEINSKKW